MVQIPGFYKIFFVNFIFSYIYLKRIILIHSGDQKH